MVDSLIENVHREDLTPREKGKFCLDIKKQMKLNNNEEVSKLINVSHHSVHDWIDDYEFRKRTPGSKDKNN